MTAPQKHSALIRTSESCTLADAHILRLKNAALCIYEGDSFTSVEFDGGSSSSTTSNALNSGLKRNSTDKITKLQENSCCTRYAILPSGDARDNAQLDIICTQFLSRAITTVFGLHTNHRLSVQDVRRIHTLINQLLANDPGYFYRCRRSYDCPCNRDGCSVGNVLNALGFEFDWSQYQNICHEVLNSRGRISESNTTIKKMRVCLAVDSTELDPTPASTLISNNGQDSITILPKILYPVISITLHATLDSVDSDRNVMTNPLLRSCIKRLLVGRQILFLPEESSVSMKSMLSVQVPYQSDTSEQITLSYRVTSVQSKANTTGICRHVILPSTRIIFQQAEKKQESEDTQQSRAPMVLSQIVSGDKKQKFGFKAAAPHEYLLEALHSILMYNDTTNGITAPPILRTYLFSGPPGVGKTFAVKQAISIANCWFSSNQRRNSDAIKLVSIRGSELLASADGGQYAAAARELEKQFRTAVSLIDRKKCLTQDEPDAYPTSTANDPTEAVIIFLDECDALVSSSIVVAAMLAMLLDSMESKEKQCTGWSKLVVAAATNRVDAIPTFLRRPGRLEKEVVVSPPDADERFALLKNMLSTNVSDSRVKINDVDLQSLAETCVGYVAADLAALVRRASILSTERLFCNDSQTETAISIQDLISATNDVGASCLRDASLSAPPKTTWDDIAGNAGGAKQALRQAIEWPRSRNVAFKALGLSPPRGVLLHGPPGCAKTSLARAAAGSAGVAFLSLSPADVYSSSYVGEAESVVRRAFDLARSAAPCVLFFDEIDSIIGGDDDCSGHGMGRGSSAEARVLSTFLNEMDGVDGSVEDGVLVLGATNRPGTLDAALLRPGRFDNVIYVPPPDECGRKDILRMECKKWCDSILTSSPTSVDRHFPIDDLAKDQISGMMTGAELVGACRETAVSVMRSVLMSNASRVRKPMDLDLSNELLQALRTELESRLRQTQPLLSDQNMLDEYTRFEEEHKS